MKRLSIFMLNILLFASCSQRQDPITPPWANQLETADSTGFDLVDIQQAGELIGLTLSGPDTYYSYHGRHLGTQYLLGERFANEIGVRLRVEVCRDSAELFSRLSSGDGDVILLPADTIDHSTPGWIVGQGKTLLSEAIQSWYSPKMLEEVRLEEKQMFSQPLVSRRVYAPMLSRGVISYYDSFFRNYAKHIGWDWRLLAAQCYQESTFDPRAQSWAGAQGLMQIMPGTADHLGLSRDDMHDPEKSIAAATRYLRELDEDLVDVHDHYERQNLVLASYNGGLQHVRDAMRLAKRDGKNPHVWEQVKPYILRLSQPKYYRDSLVQAGYMRGQETVEYVDHIRERYMKYRKSAR